MTGVGQELPIATDCFTARNLIVWASGMYQEEIAQVSSERLVKHWKQAFKDLQW